MHPPAAPRVYGRTARTFHWLTVALLLWQVAVAFYMVGMPFGPLKIRVYSWHEWSGLTIFGLTAARLAWRMMHPPPPSDLPALIRFGSGAVHAALYALLFVIPISGYVMSNALAFPVVLFGLIPLPDPVGPNRELGMQLIQVHFWLGMTLVALFCLHAGAALFHHFVVRDDTLRRMLPRAGRSA